MADDSAPSIADIRASRDRLLEWLVITPVLRCRALEQRVGDSTRVQAKLEFLQRTGTFKPRGALATLLSLDDETLAGGVTAVSAGNHAIATAFAARAVGTTAKVVMMKQANPFRIQACKELGAELILVDNVHEAFERVETIRDREGRYFVHPFEGPQVALGTGGVGLEICEQVADFDALVIPIGGGGLCGGIANAVRQLNPRCEIIGVEPEGAATMHKSFASGRAEAIDAVDTIADSLGAPYAAPYSFSLCRDNVDDLVTVSDAEISNMMGILFRELKIAVEPACAASSAALCGPLRSRLAGRSVVVVFCGSNMDWNTFATLAQLN